MNTLNGNQTSYNFANPSFLIQCCPDNLEHPIVTRMIVYMYKDNSLCWDYIKQVNYTCSSFSNHKDLYLLKSPTATPHKSATAKLLKSSDSKSVFTQKNDNDDDFYDMMIRRCEDNYGKDVYYIFRI